MDLMNQESGYALKMSDQLHIHLPSNAFTNEASNFWFGALFGAGILLVALSSLANQ